MSTSWIHSARTSIWIAASMAVFFIASIPVSGQTYLFDNIQLYDATSNKTFRVAKPNSISSSQTIVMPSTVGEPGQLLSIVSLTSGIATLGWRAEAVGTKPPSDRLTSSQSATSPSGLSVAVTASRVYSFNGLLLLNRANAGGTPSDNFTITVTGPSGTTAIDLSIRCYNCPDGTLNGTQYRKTTSTSVASLTIDPAGSSTTDFSQCAFSIEGRIVVGTTSDRLTVTAGTASNGTNNVVVGEQSFLMVTEIKK